MADLTHGAVDSLLGLLSSVIKDEARLLGGVQGDMQFIKDEMDSMNGFLLHLTKSETKHNDQHRAWMKQVRDIAYIAEDCIQLYTRDLTPPDDGEGGLWATVRHLPVFLRTMPARHRLATKIRELKVRVRDVGERRLRYGVTVPENADSKSSEPADQDGKDISKKRKAFLRALDNVQEANLASFDEAIALLVLLLGDDPEGLKTTIHSILKCMRTIHIRKMFLCALHAFPNGKKQDLEVLKEKLEKYRARAGVHKEVMIFCYSKLSTHYKSCLQYLSAFGEENKISRTSLVRRWVAEGLVVKGDKENVEEAGEACFDDLVFLGFISPCDISDTGRVKSCKMDVREFIADMAKSENFVAGLPAHLGRQLKIREIVKRQRQHAAQLTERSPLWSIGDLCAGPRRHGSAVGGRVTTAAERKDPMDDLVDLLKSLPEEYRLNVMDLGGCTGLKKRHLKSVCKVISLKYLSLRKTNVTRLPRQITHLRQLETLDVRETEIRPGDMSRIYLPKLKHLLAGQDDDGGDTAWPPKVPSLSTVNMPLYIGGMTKLEILSHVSVSRGGAALRKLDLLKNLRKLGVVIDGDDQASVEYLLRAIGRLSGIRSLSVWIKHKANHTDVGVNLDKNGADGTFAPPVNLESLFINGNVGGNGLPEWIRGLHNLSEVTLCETSLPGQSLQILAALQGLRSLCLRHKSFVEDNLTFNAGEFASLESLRVVDDKINRIIFHDDAAQKLEKIFWSFATTETSTLSGVQGLTMLKKLELNAYGDPNANSKMKEQLKQDIEKHPNSLDFRFSKPLQVQ